MALGELWRGIYRTAGYPFGRPLFLPICPLFLYGRVKVGLVKVRHAEYKGHGGFEYTIVHMSPSTCCVLRARIVVRTQGVL